MALLGNGHLYLKSPGRFRSGATISGDRAGWSTNGAHRARFVGEGGWSPLSSVPEGNRPPVAWILPEVAGALASRNIIAGEGEFAAAGTMGVNAEADLAGSGSVVDALGGLIVSAVATLTGSGAVTNADARAYLNAAATLAGSGSLDAAVDAIGHAVAALTGVGAVDAVPHGVGTLEADLTPFAGELTAAGVAAAVWDTPQGRFLYALSRNKVVTDPAAGTYTVYDDDDVTPLYTASLWQDAAGILPYNGNGADRRDRLV